MPIIRIRFAFILMSRTNCSRPFDRHANDARHSEGFHPSLDLAENDKARSGNAFAILPVEDRHVRPGRPVADGPNGIVTCPLALFRDGTRQRRELFAAERSFMASVSGRSEAKSRAASLSARVASIPLPPMVMRRRVSDAVFRAAGRLASCHAIAPRHPDLYAVQKTLGGNPCRFPSCCGARVLISARAFRTRPLPPALPRTRWATRHRR